MPLSPQWRRALEILDNSGWSGATHTELTAQGFSTEMIRSLVLSGRVATVEAENAADDPPANIMRMRITNLGRRELGV